jgi:hypothetical protein
LPRQEQGDGHRRVALVGPLSWPQGTT